MADPFVIGGSMGYAPKQQFEDPYKNMAGFMPQAPQAPVANNYSGNINLLGQNGPAGGYTQDANGWNVPNWSEAQTQNQSQPQSSPFTIGGSEGNGGYGASYSTTSGPNPYLKEYGDALTKQSTQNFLQNTMPQIRNGAQAAGQYGGSRQGIAEGVAAGNASTGLGANLANLYSSGYNTDSNYNLGLGGLQLQNKGLDQSFYNANRGMDLQQDSLGASMFSNGVNGQAGLGQGQYNVGNIYQNAPLNSLESYSKLLNPYTGYGQSNTNSSSQGGGVNGMIGGAMTAAQLWSILNGGTK